MSSHRERQTEALEDLEFYARQRYEREYRERYGMPEERYVDNSSIGKPYVPPRLAAVRAVSTGWHFLPVASWMCQLTLALVERMDLPLWPVAVGWVVLGLAAPAALVVTAKRQRIPLRLQRAWAARRILTRVERRTSYSAFALASTPPAAQLPWRCCSGCTRSWAGRSPSTAAPPGRSSWAC
jgi:hypothetical protein